MVRAILEGKKTQTRRPIKGYGNCFHVSRLLGDWALSEEPEIIEITKEHCLPRKFNKDKFALEWELQTEVDDSCIFYERLPYQPRETLYVRETWQESEYFDYSIKGKYMYRANECDEEFADLYNVNWKPSIHMPKKAARIFLKVTDVRVEKVQDITFTVAIAEGIECTELYHELLDECSSIGVGTGSLPVQVFAELWDNLYGNWNENPWVWVIEFERIEKP